MMSHQDILLLECRVLETDRQCRVLLAENELLRSFLREASTLIQASAREEDARAFIDKLERFL